MFTGGYAVGLFAIDLRVLPELSMILVESSGTSSSVSSVLKILCV